MAFSCNPWIRVSASAFRPTSNLTDFLDFRFIHTPVNIGLIGKHQQASSREPLGMGSAGVGEVCYDNGWGLEPPPAKDHGVLLDSLLSATDQWHRRPKLRHQSFQSSSSNMI